MSKARTLADFISDGSEFADGTISVAEVSGAAPLASPTFTGTVALSSGTPVLNLTDTDTGVDHQINGSSGIGNLAINVDTNGEGSNAGLVFRVGGTSSANEYFRLAANGDARFYDSSSNVLLFVDESGGIVLNDNGADKDFRVESTGHSTMLFVDASTSRIGIGQTNAPQGTLHVDKDIASGENYGIIQNDGTANTNTIAGWVIRDGSTITSGIRRRRDGSASPTEIGSFGDESVQFLQNNVSRIKFNNNDDSVVVNEGGVDADFRVESDSNANMFFVDAGASTATFGTNSAYGVLGVQQGASAGIPATTLGLNHVHANNKYIDFKWYNGSLMDIAQEGGSNIGINWSNTLAFNSSEVNSDFRIASDSISHLFAIDASENRVSIGGTSFSEGSGYLFNVRGGASRFANPAADVTVRLEGGGYTDPHTARLHMSGGSGDNGRVNYVFIDAAATGGGGNVENNLNIGRSEANVGEYSLLKFDYEGRAIFNDDSVADGDFRVESDNVSNMLFVDAGTNRVSVGRSNPLDTLHVQAYASTDSAARFEPNTINPSLGGADPTVMVLSQKAPTLDLNRYYSHGTIVQFRHNNDAVGSIYVSGTSTTYYTSSDYRLKENVVELTGATARLKQLQPKRFNFIADADTTVDGFLAHEVQSIVPEAIGGTKDEVDADGNPVYQGIDQSKMVPLLVATIKELEARITALESA